MSKQEEIRKGFKELLTFIYAEEQGARVRDGDVLTLFYYLHSQGVVIKADKKIRGGFVNDVWDAVHIEELEDCKVSLGEALDKAGYVAAGSLIDDV